ncbi:hypothetical protein BFW01_g9352 [Lasiodiplodia theobromae]|nr:hypothetical protein BFW01_g9352 [Lasiodiplodia theobromae]
MLKEIPYVDGKVGSVDTGPAKTARQCELQRCADDIKDRIEGLIAETQCLLHSIDKLADRAALQTSALHTIFAQRDSRANIEMAKVNHQMARDSARLASAAKRDSSSMKTIAILTTVFLPGTFVSALFSTPLVESDPSQFWIYWAITVPLTGLVMGLWAMWMYWINGKNRIKDEEAANAVESNEDKQKGNKSEKND